jgi:predicted nucleotidyltransferase
MPYGLSEHAVNKIISVFKKQPEVEKAILFGSRAKGTNREGSDIDITLKGSQLNFQTIKKIELRLDEQLLPYAINLVLYKSIKNQDLREHIDRKGIIIYQKTES